LAGLNRIDQAMDVIENDIIKNKRNLNDSKLGFIFPLTVSQLKIFNSNFFSLIFYFKKVKKSK